MRQLFAASMPNRLIRTVVIVGGAYFGAAKLGLTLAFYHPSATPVWPPTGIALAALLLLGYRAWPGVFLGAFLANLTTLGTVWTSAGIAAGNTLEVLIGAYLTNTYASGTNAFNRSQDIFKFAALGAIVSTTVSPTFGVTSLALGGFARWADYQLIWLTWWLGDVAGALIVAPLIILWSKPPHPRWDAQMMLERALFLSLLLAVGRIVFFGMFPFTYLTVPFLVWPAFRFGLRETATVIALLSVIAIWGTAEGLGPFAGSTPNEALLLLDTFIGIMVTVALSLGSVVAERKRGEEAQRFLADASTVLAEPLDSRTSLSRIAQLVVPRLADWCAVHLLMEGGSIRTVAISHRDPARGPLTRRVEDWPPPDTQAPQRVANVIRTRHAELYHEIPDVLLASVAPDPEHYKMLRNIGAKSAIVVPLLARGRTIGALTLVSTESGRHHSETDVWLVEELARRAALAIDSARLHEQMEEMLQRSETRNSSVLESALDCIVTVDHTGKIIEFNRAAQATFRCSHEEALGRDLTELILPLEVRERHNHGLPPYLATWEGAMLAKRFELTAKRLDGTSFPAELSIVRTPGEEPPVFTVFLRDITERKEGEAALKISSERLRLLIEQVPAMIWTTDTNLRFTTVQGAVLSNLGLRVDEFIGKTVLERVSDDEAGRASATAHLEALRGASHTYEFFREGRAYHCCVEPLYDLAGGIIGVIGVGLDVTERRRAEVAITEYAERLHLLSRQFVEVQEKVQQAVARELHDDIGQILTALRLVLTMAMTQQAVGTSVNLNEANSLVGEIQRRVRDLSLTLRPPELDDLGLLPALLMHCKRVSAQTGVDVAVEHTNVDAHRFSSEVETAAYRIVQEALTNVARHARVSDARVRVWATEDTIGVQVEDAGLGFDPEATMVAHCSRGLAGMHERVQLLGGHLTVESRPGEGTKITADFPYQSKRIAGAAAQ